MAGYTSEEKQEVIDRFLLGRVATPRTSLGARDVLAARDDVYSLLTTTLLLRPDSYFYVVWLAKNRLEALRRKQAAALEYILATSTRNALQRRGRAVRTTAELSNAQAALLNLNVTLGNGSQGSGSRELGPEVSRFRKSIDRFVRNELQDNVVDAGEVTETADEVRARIRLLWVDVQTRHEEMLVLGASIRSAVSNLSQVRLPEKAVQGVVTRLRERLDTLTTQLEADRTLTTHREAMLELLVMRTLLARVSSFRIPQDVLAPLVGDAPLVAGVGGTTPAQIVGTISGPFNIEPADTISFEAGSPVASSTIPFGEYSNAEVRSREFVIFPIAFDASAAFCLRVNGTLYPVSGIFLGASYASVALFLADVQAYLTLNSIPATAYIDGSRVVIRADSAGDESSIQVLMSTPGQILFNSVAMFDTYAVARPLSVRSIIDTGASYPNVRLSEARTEYGSFNGVTKVGSILDLSKVDGTDIEGTGTEFFASGTNFESAGVLAGDYLYIVPQQNVPFFPPAAPEVHQIVSVVGGGLVLATSIDADSIAIDGSSTYRIGADFRDIPAGARVDLASREVPLNSGHYRVVSGSIGQLTVDRPFFVALDTSISANIFTSYLVAAAPGAEPADGITAWPATDGATALGFTASATQERSQFTELEATTSVDFLARGVTVGDHVTLATTPASATIITSVAIDTVGVEGVDHFTGSVSYTIQSARYVAWAALSACIDTFLEDVDFKSAEFSITRLVSGAAPTNAVSQPLSTFNDELSDLADIEDYVVPYERTIDNVLRMLVEKGMDRGADLLTTLQITEFFGMHPDGVSYATHLIRTAADVVRQVAPVSRFTKSLLGSQEVRIRSRRFNT